MGKTQQAHMAHRFAFAVIFVMLAIFASAKLGSASESMPASNTNMDASYKMPTTDVVPEAFIGQTGSVMDSKQLEDRLVAMENALKCLTAACSNRSAVGSAFDSRSSWESSKHRCMFE